MDLVDAGAEPPVPRPAAGGAAAPGPGARSIGEVLAELRPEFPDITISKIRFLESEGLVEPQRTASGYRKFTRADIHRLRYVLTSQRDHYLPLKVIKDNLEAMDRGLEPAGPGGSLAPTVPEAAQAPPGLPGPQDFAPAATELRLSRAELLATAGLADEQLRGLEEHGLITPREGSGYYDGDALSIASTVAQMARFGIEARHLRAFKTAADREIGLVQQVVTPLVRQRSPDARAQAEQTAREIAALSIRLHAALVKKGLGPSLHS